MQVCRDKKLYGAEEGTRTPTPLRVHGPEPCASANSATSARKRSCRTTVRLWKRLRTTADGYLFIVAVVGINCQTRGGSQDQEFVGVNRWERAPQSTSCRK